MSDAHDREKLRLDGGWRFHLGEIPSPVPNTHIAAYMNNKAGWSRGGASANLTIQTGESSISRTIGRSKESSIQRITSTAAFCRAEVAWYRRHFRLEPADRGKSLDLQFDGVATHCTVYVNGHLLHRNVCGYTPFTIDITDIANFGDALNVLSVRVDATYMEGWWYEGADLSPRLVDPHLAGTRPPMESSSIRPGTSTHEMAPPISKRKSKTPQTKQLVAKCHTKSAKPTAPP